MYIGKEEGFAVLASSQDDSKLFFVGKLPEVSKAHYFARSVLHKKEDFILMLPFEDTAKKVVRYMNDHPQIFHGWDHPEVLADKVLAAIQSRKLVLA